MIVRLMCPQCVYAVTQQIEGFTTIDARAPIVQLAEDGRYEVECEKGHHSIVVLRNLKFELLFEVGLNAIIDGYSREGVTSFASALERFYEFYWRVVMHEHSVPDEAVAAAWKPLSRQSERQVGAYIAASTILTGRVPSLLNPNKEVTFRNNVVHNGYVPSADEAIIFGDVVMNLINTELSVLRTDAPESLETVYSSLLPKNDEETSESETELCGGANILTAISVLNPPDPASGDVRVGGVAEQFERILQDRQPQRMHLFTTENQREEYEKKAALERKIRDALSDNTKSPGAVLHEIIQSLRKDDGQKFTLEEIAKGLGVSQETFTAIIDGRHFITPEMALRLASSFTYTNPEYWLTLQSNFNLAQAQTEFDPSSVQIFLRAT